MIKPIKQTLTYYDYHKCKEYLDDKYGCDHDDYASCAESGYSDDVPYQSLWHFVLKKSGVDGPQYAYFDMCEWWGDDTEPWQKEILGRFLDEFGEGEAPDRSISFYAVW